MVRGGQRPKKTNWPLIIQAATAGFMILSAIVAGLYTWAYLGGQTATKIEALEHRVSALERQNERERRGRDE